MPKKTPDIYEGQVKNIKIALCQVYTEEWAVDENLSRTLQALEEAALKGTELAITPECVLHGYGFEESEALREKLMKVSEGVNGENMKRICSKVKELGINAVVGFAELDENNEIHNSSALISSAGEIVYVYRKVHCRPFEDERYFGAFTAGKEFYSAEVQFKETTCNIGTMICFDREIPESVRVLRKLGAQFIACPLATDTTAMDEWKDMNNELVTRVRAAENEVFIAVVNHAGRFNGGSFVVGPGGEVLCQMGKEAGVEVIDIPVSSIAEKFHNNPLGWMGFGYRRVDVYNKYLNE
jgi:N-carbamoylputrescine amidase